MKRLKHKRITKSKANRQKAAFIKAVMNKEAEVIQKALTDYIKRDVTQEDLVLLSFAMQGKDDNSIISSMHYGYDLVGHIKKEFTSKGVIVSFKKYIENDENEKAQ